MRSKNFYLAVLILTLAFNMKASNFDTSRFMGKVYLAYELQNQKPDSAFLLARELLVEAKNHNYKEGIAYAKMRIGSIYLQQGRNDSALQYIGSTISIREQVGDEKGAASACVLMGYVLKESNQIDSALYYYLKSLRVIERLKDSTSLVDSYLELGHLYMDYNKADKGKNYYGKALEVAKILDDTLDLSMSYSGLGKYFFESADYDSALYCYNKALDGFTILSNQLEIARVYHNIASCFSYSNRKELAVTYYKKALTDYLDLGLEEDVGICYFNIASVFEENRELDSSIYYYNKAKEIAIELSNIEDQVDVYFKLSKIYFSKRNYEQAHDNLMNYSALKDSLLNSEKISSIAEMQTKYETEKKEQQIVLLDEQNKAKEAQRNLFIAIASILFILVFALSFVFIQRRKIAQKNELIAEQKIEALLDEQEIKTNNAMLQGQEEERMRIATDLHDRLGSMLSTVKLLFSSLDEKIDKAQEENQQRYEKANDLLDEACVEVRRISHNLGAGMVAGFGLIKALEELCESIDHSGRISCSFSTYGEVENALTLTIEIGIYRIVQEIFNNALKHSKAKKMNLQINRLEEEDLISIMVEDNGVGFNVDNAKKKEGMGLKNLEKRVEELKGSLHIDSTEGKGTTTVIEITTNQES